ncbi:DUF624 domain-containing protein [Jeotgalibacillus sp. ET6]|uniref:DUF624 domain-containing protein n=1 Tax=Jeotgalibacillus sp. ET6 TaxID=3037260 RepID=UPI00241822BB|nr:DUF624 domain-containing protein [Jeotgalibacillus sp. ET6]MDG5472204.1 DUF624 domain-containing protein [Jeotgalibacillus sp. ET6]
MIKGFLGIMEMFASFVLLNLLLFVYSLLIITFIPALAAAIETMHKWKKEGLSPYFIHSFHTSFKKHAGKTSLTLSGIWFAGLTILAADAWLAASFVMAMADVLYVTAILFFVMWLLMMPYMTVQTMKTDLNVIGIIKNSFLLLWIEWKRSLAMLAIFAACLTGVLIMPFISLITGSLLAISIYSIFIPVIRTYYTAPLPREVME